MNSKKKKTAETESNRESVSSNKPLEDQFKKYERLFRNEFYGTAVPTDTSSPTIRERHLIKLKELDESSRKSREILDSGRTEGAKANKNKAETRKKALRDAAKYHFKNEPNLTYKECVNKLKTEPETKTYVEYNKGKIYSDSRILKLISGTKKEALIK